MIANFDVELNLSHKLLLNNQKVANLCENFSNNSSANSKRNYSKLYCQLDFLVEFLNHYEICINIIS